MGNRKNRKNEQAERDHQAELRRKLADEGIHVRLKPGAKLTDDDVVKLQAIIAKMNEEFGRE
jgi:hypothetical protein